MLHEVLRNIEQRRRFVLTSHARPDGDAIGSALACGQILRCLGKEAEVVLRDPVPRIYQLLPFAEKVVQADRINGDYEAAITSKRKAGGGCDAICQRSNNLALLDIVKVDSTIDTDSAT